MVRSVCVWCGLRSGRGGVFLPTAARCPTPFPLRRPASVFHQHTLRPASSAPCPTRLFPAPRLIRPLRLTRPTHPLAPHACTQFVAQLNRMFERSKTKGTVFLTSKRCTSVGRDSPPTPHAAYAARAHRARPLLNSFSLDTYTKRAKKGSAPDAAPASPSPSAPPATHPVLYRAVCGKSKISALVAPADLAKFNQAYLGIVRAQMTTLKKKEKAKKPRAKKAAGPPSPAGVAAS